jgi:hypothetical protein
MSERESTNPPPGLEPHPVLASLEPDQLATARRRFPRRSLKGPEIILVWGLRFYLLFMMAVVIYQMWSGVE